MTGPRDIPLARGMVIAKILSARTIEGCERSNALIDEWVTAFPEDEEVASYGGFVVRMQSALRWIEAHPEADRDSLD